MEYVARWQTPHLIIHGQHDFRLPLSHVRRVPSVSPLTMQGVAAFTALQRKGVPSKLLYFTMENHWVRAVPL